MIRKVDKGKTIFQNTYKITDKDTLISAYQKAYSTAVKASIEALNIIRDKKPSVLIKHKMKSSYNSFPKKSDWKEFSHRGLKFI